MLEAVKPRNNLIFELENLRRKEITKYRQIRNTVMITFKERERQKFGFAREFLVV